MFRLCFFFFSVLLSFMLLALLKCLLIFICSFMYEVIKSRLEVLCAWGLLWSDWVNHFLESSQVLVSATFFPLRLFSFSRGKFSTVLPALSMPGYQASCNLKNNDNFENIVLSCISNLRVFFFFNSDLISIDHLLKE